MSMRELRDLMKCQREYNTRESEMLSESDKRKLLTIPVPKFAGKYLGDEGNGKSRLDNLHKDIFLGSEKSYATFRRYEMLPVVIVMGFFASVMLGIERDYDMVLSWMNTSHGEIENIRNLVCDKGFFSVINKALLGV